MTKPLVQTRFSERTLLSFGKITHVFGPPKIGKSTLSATIALELALLGQQTMIISTERPIEIRMDSMIAAHEHYSKTLLEQILTRDIFTMKDLVQVIVRELPKFIGDSEVLIIDSLTASYRTNPGPITLSLLRQVLSSLQMLAIKRNLAVLFTNQVAAKMDDTSAFRPVASASTRGYSDCNVRLSKALQGGTELVFETFDGEEEEVLLPFNITAAGIEEFQQLFLVNLPGNKQNLLSQEASLTF